MACRLQLRAACRRILPTDSVAGQDQQDHQREKQRDADHRNLVEHPPGIHDFL